MVGDVPMARLYGMAVGVEIEFKMAKQGNFLGMVSLVVELLGSGRLKG
jgi:hypothetical protein